MQVKRRRELVALALIAAVVGFLFYREFQITERHAVSTEVDTASSRGEIEEKDEARIQPVQSASERRLTVDAALASNSIVLMESLDQASAPTARLDKGEFLRQAKSICNMFASRPRSTVEFLRTYALPSELSEEQVRSGELVDQFRERFCTDGVDREGEGVTASVLDELRADLEATKLEAIRNGLEIPDDASEEEVVAVREALVEVLATTESPTAFALAAEPFLHDTSLARSFPAEGFHPSHVDPVNPTLYRQVGTMLAYCRLVPGACGPGSLTVMRVCLPGNCRAGESVHMFYMRTSSPQLMTDAQRYAQYLLSLRTRG